MFKVQSAEDVGTETYVIWRDFMSGVVGRGKKQCKSCGAVVGVRTKVCQCGQKFAVKNNRSKTSGKAINSRAPEKAAIDQILTAIEIVNLARQQELSIEEFVTSTNLSWEVLQNVNSMKDLKALKGRQKYGEFVDEVGREGALKLCRYVIDKMA